MARILIIGLPKGAQHLVDTFAKGAGLLVTRVYAEVGNRGTLALLPRPEHCLPEVRRYLDASGGDAKDYSGSNILVLPYAEVPADCIEELRIAEEMGAAIIYPNPENDATWPKITRKRGADQEFLVQLASRIREYLSPFVREQHEMPSAFIRQLAHACPSFLIASSALDECDKVAPHRYDFICNSVTLLVDAVTNGFASRFHDHCAKKGLHHAQTGGSKFTVSVYFGTEKQPDVICQTHLKQGDRTTKEAAARVYYTFLDVGHVRYVALLYAGPHPEGEFNCKVEIPEN